MNERRIILAAAGVTGAYAAYRYHQLATGDVRLDRPGIRGRALLWGVRLSVPPEALMALAHQEGQAWLNPQMSDSDIDRGPSVGPLAVLRTTAIGEGDVPAGTDATTYAAYADPSHEGLTFGWGARYFAKVYASHGRSMRAALTSYNGSSTYADSGLTWLASTYPRFAA